MAILLAFTDTKAGRDALKLAVIMARSLHTTIHAVTVVVNRPSVTVPPDAKYNKLVTRQSGKWLKKAVSQIPVEVKTHVRRANSPAAGLLAAIDEFSPSFLVIAGGRHGATGKVSLGSVGQTLLNASPVPVALAPRGYRKRTDVRAITEVTVGADKRPGNANLMKFAIAIAKEAAAPLRLLSLIAVDKRGKISELEKEARSHIDAVYSTAVKELGKKYPIERSVVKGTSVEKATASVKWDLGGIALLGSSSLAFPKRAFMGNVANHILRELPVPLVVVPKDGDMDAIISEYCND
ncbi:MAG: universal stress protein [Actinomycetaceae bacterium]|nr:universal stress protein [Arcanobacterium sp.]MDD7687399.1 universal stress protein [Actinomycetaceae bacterium]MDY5272874.1 universal stress protein [Arcanobacterium sp.]